MKPKFAELIKIENDHEVGSTTDSAFLYSLHRGLLLALRELGYLNDPQLRLAEELLDRQWEVY